MSDDDRLNAELFALRTRNERLSRGLTSLFSELERLSGMSGASPSVGPPSRAAGAGERERSFRVFFSNSLRTETGKIEDGIITVRAKRPGFALYGPYVTIRPGLYHLCFYFGDSPEPAGDVTIQLHSQAGGVTHKKTVQLDTVGANAEYRMLISVHREESDYEFRIRGEGPVQFSLRGLSLQEAEPSDLPPFVLVE